VLILNIFDFNIIKLPIREILSEMSRRNPARGQTQADSDEGGSQQSQTPQRQTRTVGRGAQAPQQAQPAQRQAQQGQANVARSTPSPSSLSIVIILANLVISFNIFIFLSRIPPLRHSQEDPAVGNSIGFPPSLPFVLALFPAFSFRILVQ
jgi:hypothetical protein